MSALPSMPARTLRARDEAANAAAHLLISQDSWCKEAFRHCTPMIRCNQPPNHDGAHGFIFKVGAEA